MVDFYGMSNAVGLFKAEISVIIMISNHTQYFGLYMEPEQVLPLRVRMNLEVMATKVTQHSPEF